VRLLLDTHVALWFFDDPLRIDTGARAAIESTENSIFVSAASVWEWALKRAAARASAPGDLPEGASRAGFAELPVTWRHGQVAASLPLVHRDPFDRMLVAQAQAERMVLVTRDRDIPRYDVSTMAA